MNQSAVDVIGKVKKSYVIDPPNLMQLQIVLFLIKAIKFLLNVCYVTCLDIRFVICSGGSLAPRPSSF